MTWVAWSTAPSSASRFRLSSTSRAQVRKSSALPGPASSSLSCGSAQMRTALSWLIAWVRALDRRVLGQFVHPGDLHWPVTRLGLGACPPAQHRSGRVLGIERVGLAAPAAVGPVEPVHIENVHALGQQVAGQGRPERTGTFHSGPAHRTRRPGPPQQVSVSSRTGRELLGADHLPHQGEHSGHMGIPMRVHSQDHLRRRPAATRTRSGRCADHARSPSGRGLIASRHRAVRTVRIVVSPVRQASTETRPVSPRPARTAPGRSSTQCEQDTSGQASQESDPAAGQHPPTVLLPSGLQPRQLVRSGESSRSTGRLPTELTPGRRRTSLRVEGGPLERQVNDRQLSVLQWAEAGCPAGAWETNSYKTTCQALHHRGLVTVSRVSARRGTVPLLRGATVSRQRQCAREIRWGRGRSTRHGSGLWTAYGTGSSTGAVEQSSTGMSRAGFPRSARAPRPAARRRART